MQTNREEALQPEPLVLARAEKIVSKQLVLFAGDNPFFNAVNYAAELKQSFEKRFSAPATVECFKLRIDSITELQKLVRSIARFDSVQIVYDATISFVKNVLPAVVISRFFGKPVQLGYYPTKSTNKVPVIHRKVMNISTNSFVGSKYLQRELARRNVNCDVKLPPIDLKSFPKRTVTEVQPGMAVVFDGSEDSAIKCAVLAFYLVQQKYPRAELNIIMNESNADKLPSEILELSQSGIELRVCSNNEAIVQEFSKADLFLNCNYRETAPLELFVAMALGLPTISFETYGAREIIENGINGFLIRHNDHSQMADRTIELIENREVVLKISNEASKVREKLTAASLH